MIKKIASSYNQIISECVVEELIRLGVECFFISPGSRSAPLTAAISKTEKAVVIIDERSAAFAALGYGRAVNKSAVLICTSGTAGANYFPAIVEAYYDEIPLLVITADRPPELHNVKSNQTINQQNLYGNHINFFVNLEPPESNISPEVYLTEIDRAFKKSHTAPQGPVHINMMFKEPLAPACEEIDFSFYLQSVKEWMESDSSYLKFNSKVVDTDEKYIEEIDAIINNRDGIIVCGDLKNENDRTNILQLASQTGWPLFPDIRSGLKAGYDSKNLIPYFDQLLLSEKYKTDKELNILHFGGAVTSKRFLQFIESIKIGKYYNINLSRTGFNPHHKLTNHLPVDISIFCRHLLSNLENKSESLLLDNYRSANKTIADVLKSYFDDNNKLTEPNIARLISQNISKDSILFLGSSMPIRDYDMYSDPAGIKLPIAANRGASGIDGSVASFFGFSCGHNKKGTAIIGDLALLHDLNSLALLNLSEHPLTLIIINNNGGGIFSFLPVADCQDIFEKYFGTPHNLFFEHAARMFSLSHHNPKTVQQFVECYKQSQTTPGAALIEITTDRKENFKEHQVIQNLIKKTLKDL